MNNISYICSMKSMMSFTLRHILASLMMMFMLVGSTVANAQMVIKENGKVIVGPNTRPSDDSLNVTSMSIQGPLGVYNHGAKLGFGDFGVKERIGWNVFVGEYGNTDSDQLWLHGKNGFKITNWNGDYVIAGWGWDSQFITNFTFNTNSRIDRIAISSADAHKYEVSPIENPLSALSHLKGIKFRYTPVNVMEMPNVDLTNLDDKGLADYVQMDNVVHMQQKGRIRYGLYAGEVANVFPELVEVDDKNNEYINYIELIPVLINAINELTSQLQEHGLLRGMRTQTDSSETDRCNAGTRGAMDESAVLYQNTPNPFTDNTTIEFYIPVDASSASVYLFTLNGLLLETYPIEYMGYGTITIDGSTLQPGMYVYSLVVDGQIVDNKRMILTD